MSALSQRYLPGIDGLRTISLGLVFTCHYLPSVLPGIRNWGWIGVDFFFVLSGFLITGILFDSQDHPQRFRNFYGRRILRIWPLYYGLIAVVILSQMVFHWRFAVGHLLWLGHLGNWARYLFFNQNHPLYLDMLERRSSGHGFQHLYFGHFWTLCIEEQFYLLWPLVVFTIRSQARLLRIALSIVILEPVLRACLFFTLPEWLLRSEFLYRSTLTRIDGLMLGAVIALMMRGPEIRTLTKFPRLLSILLCVPFFAVVLEYRLRTKIMEANIRDGSISTIGFSATAMLGAALLLEILREGSVVKKMLSVKPLVWLGGFTYGAYIFHDLFHDVYTSIVVRYVHTAFAVTVLVGVLGAVSTLVLSILSRRFFEEPFLALKRHLPL